MLLLPKAIGALTLRLVRQWGWRRYIEDLDKMAGSTKLVLSVVLSEPYKNSQNTVWSKWALKIHFLGQNKMRGIGQ